MFTKIASFCLLVAITSASYIPHQHQENYGHSSGQAVSSQKIVQDFTPNHGSHYNLEDFQHHDSHQYNQETSYPKYRFEYSVDDPETEDKKSHWESRDGDAVEGEYSLQQPDGSTRTVTYKADKENGFQAQVSTTGDENAYHSHESDLHQHLNLQQHQFY